MASKTKPAAAKREAAAPPAPPRPRPPQDIRLHGSLDRADADGRIEAWSWSPDEPQVPRELAILVDGAEVARLLADVERADLKAASVGNGCHALRTTLPPQALPAGRPVTVTLRDVATGKPVGRALTVERHDPSAAAAAPAAPAEAALATLHGHVDRVSRDGWVAGWCWYPDRPGEHVDLVVLVDDVRVGAVRASNFRPDLQQAGVGDGTHGFAFALPYAALADKGTLLVAVQEARTGRNLSDPVTVRLGRVAAAEDRIRDLERQIKLLRGQIDEVTRLGEARDEDRAARELFATVAEFFADLAKGGPGRGSAREFGAAGLAGALEDVAARYATMTLAAPDAPAATVVVAATGNFDSLYRCLAALQQAGVDRSADIVLLDDGGHGGSAALLPTVVRNLRYVRLHDGGGLIAGRNEAARTARAPLVAFLAPQARVLPGWLDEMSGTFAREPEAVVVGGRLVREDGLLHHAYLIAAEDGTLRDPGHLASYELAEHGFMRRADALAGLSFAVRREPFLAAGGFSTLFSGFGSATAELCARLRAGARTVLYQPLAIAAWVDHGVPEVDGAPPDLSIANEDALRLRARLQHEGWPAGPGTARFAGHALVVDDDLPRPDRDAGSIATYEQMIVLRRLGWHVTFCPIHALTLESAATAALLRDGIEVAGPPEYGSVTQYLQSHGAALGLVHVYRYANMAMLQDRIHELAPDARVIFATADLHFLREQRRAELAGKALPEAAREDELRCMHAADATIVTSDYELALLQADVPPDKLVLLRWITRPQPVTRGFAERRDICFVGNFRHPPNLDGVEWFLSEVFPRVRRLRPEIRFRLAGSDLPPSLRDFADDSVEILGWVADLADLFGAARMSVAPLRFGAGFKGKVATSLAYGLPVVGSTISLEGTGLAEGDGVLVADDPAAFAAAIVRLYDDPALWQRLSARGLERIAALYSPAAATAVWRSMLTRLERPVAP